MRNAPGAYGGRGPLLVAHAGLTVFGGDEAAEYLELAARAGFDAVKFPLYDASWYRDAISTRAEMERMKRAKLVGGQVASLLRKATARGIGVEFECFTVAALDLCCDHAVPNVGFDFRCANYAKLWQRTNWLDYPGTIAYVTDNDKASFVPGRMPLLLWRDAPGEKGRWYDSSAGPAWARGRLGVRIETSAADAVAEAWRGDPIRVEVSVTAEDGRRAARNVFRMAGMRALLREVRHADPVLVGQLPDESGTLGGAETGARRLETAVRKWRPIARGGGNGGRGSEPGTERPSPPAG